MENAQCHARTAVVLEGVPDSDQAAELLRSDGCEPVPEGASLTFHG